MSAHRHVIKRDRVVLAGSPAAHGAAARPKSPAATRAPSAHGAAVRLLSHDGVVRGIELTCACGDVTVVELSYDSAARPNTKG